MGHLANASLGTIEEWLDGIKYGDLEMDDVCYILMVLVARIRRLENDQRHTANIASCLANGITPD